MNKHLTKVLKEMCKRVDADFDKIDFKSDDWYMQYSWTDKQQAKFDVWLTNYLHKNKEAFEHFSAFPYFSKRQCVRVASAFIFNYGWRSE